MKNFINLSNNNSKNWNKEQLESAQQIGNIINIKLPENLDKLNLKQTQQLALNFLEKVNEKYYPCVILCDSQSFAFQYAITKNSETFHIPVLMSQEKENEISYVNINNPEQKLYLSENDKKRLTFSIDEMASLSYINDCMTDNRYDFNYLKLSDIGYPQEKDYLEKDDIVLQTLFTSYIYSKQIEYNNNINHEIEQLYFKDPITGQYECSDVDKAIELEDKKITYEVAKEKVIENKDLDLVEIMYPLMNSWNTKLPNLYNYLKENYPVEVLKQALIRGDRDVVNQIVNEHNYEEDKHPEVFLYLSKTEERNYTRIHDIYYNLFLDGKFSNKLGNREPELLENAITQNNPACFKLFLKELTSNYESELNKSFRLSKSKESPYLDRIVDCLSSVNLNTIVDSERFAEITEAFTQTFPNYADKLEQSLSQETKDMLSEISNDDNKEFPDL